MLTAPKTLIAGAFVSVVMGIGLLYFAATSDDRARQTATEHLQQMGAYFVGFDEDAVVPDSAYFANVRSLDGIERYPSLTHLDFTESDVADSDLDEVSQLPKLFYLELDGTRVSDQGIAKLAQIPNLNVLVLTDTPITDESVPNLARISGLQGIATEGTQLTDSGVQQLMQLRPDIWVKHEAVTDSDEQSAENGFAENTRGETFIPQDEQ